ncbi:glucokinase [Yinghuangia sp. ASG 101]|uniref:glucokinase n=1 Tax=Yinghuangia sp. ASG 101 TaxID=2896848 RepID=UPI001E4BBC43|nr:glucokinase [Yinghuangia sp. ASG 101]UGQ15161.1 glucokinase [Yinghuangia sp. ASG 101]
MTHAFPLPSAERPWLVADIGGTNARFGLITRPGGRAERILVLRTAEHRDLESAVGAYLSGMGVAGRPSAMCAAVAGPVTGDHFRFTNGSWALSISETRCRLGVDELRLINDFEALAWSLPHLRDDDILVLGDRRPDTALPMAVLGPGTGLGVAGLVPVPGGGWVPLPGEGGHILLRPGHGEDAEAIDALRGERGVGLVTAEHVLSGPGLTRLYRYVAGAHGEPAEALSPADISARALAGTDQLCTATIEVFCRLLGTFAGGVALTMGARGGVFLAGGVLPRIAELLVRSEFRDGFTTNPTMAAYLHRIPTVLVTAPYPALLGARAWLETHSGSESAVAA